MFAKNQILPHVDAAFARASGVELEHLSLVKQSLVNDSKSEVLSYVKPLNRYSIQQGKTFSASTKAKEKYKILRVIADDIVYQELHTGKVISAPVDKLLKDWSERGLKEVSFLEEVIQTVKNLLGPVLGVFLTTALVTWLIEKLK